MIGVKVWCLPINFPNPDTEPEQAEAARKFIQRLNGLRGVSVNQDSGMMILAFGEVEHARSAKWKLEEFSPVGLHIIEGTLTEDGKRLDLRRVLKGE